MSRRRPLQRRVRASSRARARRSSRGSSGPALPARATSPASRPAHRRSGSRSTPDSPDTLPAETNHRPGAGVVSDTSGVSHTGTGPDDGSAADGSATDDAHDDAGVAHRDAEAAHRDAEELHRDAEQMHRDAEEMRVDAERTHRDADMESFGPLGRPMRRDSPIRLGFLGAMGVFFAWFLIQAIIQARSVLILIV